MKKDDDAFPCILDFKPGFFLTWLLYRLFKKAQLDKNAVETVKQLHHEGTVVYASKYRGQLDFLLYHFRFRIARMPYPKMAFDLNMSLVLPFSRLFRIIRYYARFFLQNGHLPSPYETGFFKKKIEEGTTSLLCLVDPKSFSRRFIHAEQDNLAFLIEFQKNTNRPIYIVPQLVLYKKTPEKESSRFFDILFGYKDNPGTVRKIALFFRHHRQALIDFGPPLDLKSFVGNINLDGTFADSVSLLRKELINRIDQQKRVILGPVMKSRQQVKEIVLTDPEIDRTLKEMSHGKRTALKKYRKKASDYFDEIAADYNIAYIQFFQMALRWFWKKLFEGIDVRDSEITTLRESARKGVLIYVPSHKSHIDYLVLNYILLEHHMHIPRVAAGKNLTFWPMGHVFRKSGAFFIRRTFSGARLYANVFTRYIKALLAEKHPLEFFIEGGRSRSGKLILPKVGFLSILLEAFQEGYCENLLFVPVSISYDRILEEKSYIRELAGRKKERETFLQMIKARQFLKRKYGKIYIRFAPPLSLREYLTIPTRAGQPLNKELGRDIIRSINKISLITPVSLVAATVLAKHRRGFHLRELIQTAKIYLQFLESQGAPLAATLADPEKAFEDAVAVLVRWKLLAAVGPTVEEREEYYSADDEKKMELAYYSNSIIHFFLPHALVAVSLLTSKDDPIAYENVAEDAKFLKDLFQKEFVFEKTRTLDDETREILHDFVQWKYIMFHEDQNHFSLTRLGFDQLPLWGNQVKSFLESYWVTAKTLLDEKGKKGKKADRLKNMSGLAKRYYKLGIISCSESISGINFKNALNFMEEAVLRAHEGETAAPFSTADRLALLADRIHRLAGYGS